MSVLPEGGTVPDSELEGLWTWVIRQAVRDALAGNGHSQEARQWLLEEDGWHEVANLTPESVQRIRDLVSQN